MSRALILLLVAVTSIAVIQACFRSCKSKCQWSSWSNIGSCRASCGATGTQRKYRKEVQHGTCSSSKCYRSQTKEDTCISPCVHGRATGSGCQCPETHTGTCCELVVTTTPTAAPTVVTTTPTAAPTVMITASTAAPSVETTTSTTTPSIKTKTSTGAPFVVNTTPTPAPTVVTTTSTATPTVLTTTSTATPTVMITASTAAPSVETTTSTTTPSMVTTTSTAAPTVLTTTSTATPTVMITASTAVPSVETTTSTTAPSTPPEEPKSKILPDANVKCTVRAGICQHDSAPCSGLYWSGFCAGGARRRCCIPDSVERDNKCIEAGGHCQSDVTCVGGNYKTNLCAGNAKRKCCILDAQGDATDGPTEHLTKLPAGTCKNVTIVTRKEWGAREVTGLKLIARKPVKILFIHHEGAGKTCSSDCAKKVKQIQSTHIDVKKWTDIGYNYLVANDGKAYEGRGWKYVGSHTHAYNSIAFAICALGNFETERPSKTILQTIANLIACAVDEGVLDINGYEIFGHRDAGKTACPGRYLYDVIENSAHFSTRKIPKYSKPCPKCKWVLYANINEKKEI